MTDRARLALAAAQALRRSRGYAALDPRERQDLDTHLGRIEQALTYGGNGGNGSAVRDPYAVPLETPADLQRGFGPSPSSAPPPPSQSTMLSPQAPAMPAPPPGTEVIGARARQALEAVDFPAFVAGLVSGTFQAIVDSTAQQVREYATLVASITKSVGDFSRDNVSPNQVRDWLVGRHPKDLILVIPKPGERGEPRLRPRSTNAGSPAWLAQYGLADQELSDELVEGPLLEAARLNLGEERLQTLATMVLMGINRIVVNDGQIKARLQFHASAKESLKADVANQGTGQQVGIAGRETQMQAAVSTMVSTVNVNAQADVAVRANLVGEVAIKFRTETFDINRFADTQAIQLLTRHSRMTPDAAAPAESPRPPSTAPTPAPGGQP